VSAPGRILFAKRSSARIWPRDTYHACRPETAGGATRAQQITHEASPVICLSRIKPQNNSVITLTPRLGVVAA